jgi:hypothetical protein
VIRALEVSRLVVGRFGGPHLARHSDRAISSSSGTPNSVARADEQISSRCVRSHIRCPRGAAARIRSAAASRRAETIASTFARSAGSAPQAPSPVAPSPNSLHVSAGALLIPVGEGVGASVLDEC